jgi:hypothetical protein
MTELLRGDGDDGQCMMARCTETDLLPTRCTKCGRRYCTAHIAPHSHDCRAYRQGDARTVECPMCTQAVAVRPGESPDVAVMKHMETGCAPQAAQAAAANRLNMCSVHSCSRNEVQRIVCEYCRQTYCVEHRHPAKHSCKAKPVTPPPQPASAAATTTTAATKKPLYVPIAEQSPRNDVKSAAHLPPSNGKGAEPGHVVVLVHSFAPMAAGKKPKSVPPVYMSLPPAATIGRVLDGACARLDVPNNNHVVREDHLKLWLQALPSGGGGGGGDCVCLPPSMTVRECVEGGVGIGAAGVPRVMITRGNVAPAEVAADPSVRASEPPKVTPAAGTAAAAATAAPKPSPAAATAGKKKDDGCVVV